MKNHFITAYYGNKREEVKFIYDTVKDELINKLYIVEPFCGSSAISMYISIHEPGKYTYILNDNNKYLISLYEMMRCKVKINFFNCMVQLVLLNISSGSTWVERKKIYNKPDYTDYITEYIKNKYYKLRPGCYPVENLELKIMKFRPIGTEKIIQFMQQEKVILMCSDGSDVIIKYNSNESAIFLDPPYLMACNDFYADSSVFIYEYLITHHVQKKNIYLILEYNWLIKLFFKDFKTILYDKKYNGLSKKNVKHSIIYI